MLVDGSRSKILDLNSGSDRSRLAACLLLLDHCRRVQRSLKPRNPRCQNGLLLNGLQIVIVATDLTESASLMKAGCELDVKLMPHALDGCP